MVISELEARLGRRVSRVVEDDLVARFQLDAGAVVKRLLEAGALAVGGSAGDVGDHDLAGCGRLGAAEGAVADLDRGDRCVDPRAEDVAFENRVVVVRPQEADRRGGGDRAHADEHRERASRRGRDSVIESLEPRAMTVAVGVRRICRHERRVLRLRPEVRRDPATALCG